MKRQKLIWGASVVAAALGVSVAAVDQSHAAVITVANPGFEDPVLADGGFDGSGVPDWTTSPSPGRGTFNPTTTAYPSEAPEGDNIAFVASDNGQISQALTDTVSGDTTYTLEVEVGNRADIDMRGYQVQLLAGGNLLAQDDNSLAPAAGSFATATVSYTSAPSGDPNLGQPLEVRLIGLAGSGQVNFDHVRLSSDPVPEPGSLLILTAGSGLVLLARRRRRV